MTIPGSAVDHGFENVVPTLDFIHYDADGNRVPLKLDWYSKLTPEKPIIEFGSREGLPTGVSVIAKAHYPTGVGAEAYYTLEIVTNQTEEAPLQITFADGYKMDIYAAETANGNGVGVIDLYNVYKTNRHPISELVETIQTDENGIAHSSNLPLGDYIVREMSATGEYVNEGEDILVSLDYKDQFTPLIWGSGKFENKYFQVEIDLSKVFETAYKSDEYEPPKEGDKVTFGLFAGEDIKATHKGKNKVNTATLKKDQLVDVFTINYNAEGIYKPFETKLPKGKYYLKELKAPENYIKSNLNYTFIVGENTNDFSTPVTFDYALHDGVIGKMVLEQKGRVETTIRVEQRQPMVDITIDDTRYMLDEEFANENIKIDVDKDFTEIKVTTLKGTPTVITLHNGKTLKVEAKDNEFDYTIDGTTSTYVPTVTYTGYHANYEEIWKSIKGEDLNTHTANVTLTGAGTDKQAVNIKADITHTPKTEIVKEQQLIDPNDPESGYEEVEVTKGVLTPKGYQIFKHTALITASDDAGNNIIPKKYTRVAGNKTTTENFDGTGITLNPKEKITFKTVNTNAAITISMDKYGNVDVNTENLLHSNFADAENPVATVTRNGVAITDAKTVFAKNVTLGRQDTSADFLMVKINSDNKDSFAVENDHKPEVIIHKVDSENNAISLSGATFEIYEAVFTSDWESEPGKCLGEYTTGINGDAKIILDYGVYYYREVKAPSGYKSNLDYVKFRVAKGEDPFVIVVENDKAPVTPPAPNVSEDGDYLLELIKVDSKTGEKLAGAEFEIYGSTVVDGQVVRNESPLSDKPFVTDQYGKVTVSVDDAGIYFYREVKALKDIFAITISMK